MPKRTYDVSALEKPLHKSHVSTTGYDR